MEGKYRRLAGLAAVLVLTAMLTGGAVTTAAADHESGGEQDLMDDLFSAQDEEPDLCEKYIGARCSSVQAAINGWVEKNNPLADADRADADTYAQENLETFNGNSDAIQNWTNQRTNATEDWDAIRITFQDEDGGTAHVFVVSDVNHSTGDFENARALTMGEFRKLNRDVDQWYRLSPYASRNANDEFTAFLDEYVEPDESPDLDYLAGKAGKYSDEIDGSELPGDDS